MGHMHPRDVNRTASIINHPAWKASDCKLSGVNISPLLPNRLANQNSRFALILAAHGVNHMLPAGKTWHYFSHPKRWKTTRRDEYGGLKKQGRPRAFYYP